MTEWVRARESEREREREREREVKEGGERGTMRERDDREMCNKVKTNVNSNTQYKCKMCAYLSCLLLVSYGHGYRHTHTLIHANENNKCTFMSLFS